MTARRTKPSSKPRSKVRVRSVRAVVAGLVRASSPERAAIALDIASALETALALDDGDPVRAPLADARWADMARARDLLRGEPRAHAVALVNGVLALRDVDIAIDPAELRAALAVCDAKFSALALRDVASALDGAEAAYSAIPEAPKARRAGGRSHPGAVAVVARLAMACGAFDACGVSSDDLQRQIHAAFQRAK